jgi:antitoxin component of MazEF toxin-antitoxin module
MMIEIQKPELEALIHERMMSGAYHDVEDVLMQALKSSPVPGREVAGQGNEGHPVMGSELVTAMQSSPFKEIGLEPGSGGTLVVEPVRQRTVAEAIDSIRELRKGNILGDLNRKDLIHEGHQLG